MIEIKYEFAKRCAWEIGKKGVFFWFDSWIPGFFDFLADGEENMEKLWDFYSKGYWDFQGLVATTGEELAHLLLSRHLL